MTTVHTPMKINDGFSRRSRRLRTNAAVVRPLLR